MLNDFIFQRRYSERSLPSVGFGYPDSSRWLRLICSAMDSIMQVFELLLQTLSIFLPRHPVYSRRSRFLQAVVTVSEQIDVHMMQQRCEL